MLSLYKGNIKLHAHSSSYVVYIMRHTHILKPQLKQFSLHIWHGNIADAEWMQILAPQDNADLLMDSEEADDDFDKILS